jgi:hypothetical protein
MVDAVDIAEIVAVSIGAILAVWLLAIYLGSYKRVRAPFTLGLIMVALFFFFQNMMALYGYVVLMTEFSSGIKTFMISIVVLGDIALAVLLNSARQ